MEYSAIFHDMDKRFCYAIDKDLFVIRVQVKKDDMKEVILHYEDKYIPIERKDTRMTLPMKKVATSQFHDYYEAQLQMHLICLRYFFEFTDMQGEKVYYGNYEFDKECITNRDRMFDCPQNLREEEMFEVPQWAANKVVYDGCKAMINVFMKGNGCKITVGRGSLIDESTSIVLMGQGNRVEIGEECMFAEKVEIWASDTHLITDLQGNPLNPSKPVVIGKHVWLGKGVNVMKGVTIGEHTTVGLGSIVTKDLPPHCIAAGSPAKVVRTGTDWHLGHTNI